MLPQLIESAGKSAFIQSGAVCVVCVCVYI